MNNPNLQVAERQAVNALQQQDFSTALRLARNILETQPSNKLALQVCSQAAMLSGEYSLARDSLERFADLEPSAMAYIQAAMAAQRLDDQESEAALLQKALTLDPVHLVALAMKARLLERQGLRHKAAVAYGAVAAVSPPLEQLSADLRAAVVHGIQYKDRYNAELGSHLDHALANGIDALDEQAAERFRMSLDIMVGRKRRYDSQSMVFHYPGLVPEEFFKRERFPWLDGFEQRTEEIREEFLAVLKKEEGFTPYLTYPEGSPLNQWAELNNSPRWSAYHLKKAGETIADHARHCPVTMQLLEKVPQPVQIGRTPVALFSLLKPKTRIPAHVGVSNTRLLAHVPLIIPPSCGFRVGNTTREWVPGQAWVFDDTIEHEAWNMSDALRVILIFDLWHPDLTPGEQDLVSRLMAQLTEFTGEFTSYDG